MFTVQLTLDLQTSEITSILDKSNLAGQIDTCTSATLL
jgi:hypothetical protein